MQPAERETQLVGAQLSDGDLVGLRGTFLGEVGRASLAELLKDARLIDARAGHGPV